MSDKWKMMNEPKTIYDLWFMVETSDAWFDRALETEIHKKITECNVGDDERTRTTMTLYRWFDCIRVMKETEYVSDINNGVYSTSYRTHWTKDYTFDEFRASEWWDKAMKAFATGATECPDNVIADAYDDSAFIDLTCHATYEDWLGNTRTGKSSNNIYISAGLDDEILIEINGNKHYFSIEELAETLCYAERCKGVGIRVDDECVTVGLNHE